MTCKRLFLLDLLSSQCPRNVPHYYDRINKGFEAACSWLEQLLTDYGDYLGRVGSTNFVQQVVSDCSTCFDWDYYLEQQGRFQDCHKRCFYEIVSIAFASIAADNSMARSGRLSLCRASVVPSEQKSWF